MAAVATIGALQAAPSVSPAALSTDSKGSKSSKRHVMHWFRKGLRLHDNPSLTESLKGAASLRCVFLIDPWFATSSNIGINKWRFLLQCLEDLDASLKKLNCRLYVVRGQPADALPKLFRKWRITVLSFEEDPEPYGRVRDHNIIMKCREAGITVVSCVSHTLFQLDSIIERNGGKAPLTYHQFQALIANMPPPAPPQPAIDLRALEGISRPVSDKHNVKYAVPSLEELGFDTTEVRAAVWVGGETEALARLDRHLERKAWVASFGRPKMTPQSLFASSTGLSPYLRFGCLSTRLFYHELTELYKRVKRVQPPLSLHGQILWREFFYCAATRNPNFDRMEGNPICVQIPWERNQEALTKWAYGQTGYPWIDSIMVQLRQEGWIHHIARHAVACFLTRGDLWISWEEGMKVFDELMLDADWSVNAGMWMWLSCSSFFQQFFHCYCPVRFGRKTDPSGDFIRRYLPVLKNLPTRYIHEPWLAPEHVQVSARCRIGRDYPRPLVQHSIAAATNIERIKQVYAHLAQFPLASQPQPQGSANPYDLQRPNAMVLSPSPTSIIKSINHSNHLCSQIPEISQTKFETPSGGGGGGGGSSGDVNSKTTECEAKPIFAVPKQRNIIDCAAKALARRNLIANIALDEASKTHKEHLRNLKHRNHEIKNAELNNDRTKTKPENSFIQSRNPMFYVPYNDSALGLQPIYSNSRDSQSSLTSAHRRPISSNYMQEEETINNLQQDSGEPFSQNNHDEGKPFTQNNNDAGETFTQNNHNEGEPFTQNNHDAGETFTQNNHDEGEPFTQNNHDAGETFTQNNHDEGEPFTQNNHDAGETFTQSNHDEGEPFTKNNHDAGETFTQNNHDAGEPFSQNVSCQSD